MGDTGIEPVTPTVSTFSARRWLSWFDEDSVDSGPRAGWSRWLRRLVAALALHDRCTHPDSGAAGTSLLEAGPEPRARVTTRDVMRRWKATPLPSGVMAFHRAGNVLAERRSMPYLASSSVIHCWKNARSAAMSTSTSPSARSTSP